MFLSSTVWGPHYWFVLQTISMTYPETPNETIKKHYYNLIQNLPLFIPNKKMSKNFEYLLNEFPISPYLSSRLSFMKWVHFIHNKINKKIGKKEINFFKGLEKYYSNYIPEKTKKKEQFQKMKLYTSFFSGICIIIYLWYKYK
tara:strand:- start:216 stop:644 length:429 start_codon:yes stop_codon:yes gene_type:complete